MWNSFITPMSILLFRLQLLVTLAINQDWRYSTTICLSIDAIIDLMNANLNSWLSYFNPLIDSKGDHGRPLETMADHGRPHDATKNGRPALQGPPWCDWARSGCLFAVQFMLSDPCYFHFCSCKLSLQQQLDPQESFKLFGRHPRKTPYRDMRLTS